MKLRDCLLCIDCEEVFSGPSACPACGSDATFPLSRWLQPVEQETVTFARPDPDARLGVVGTE
jgi:hypothetical protein